LNFEEYTSIQEANEAAEFIDNLADWEEDAFFALLEFRSFEDVRQIYESGDYSFYDDCSTERDLGYIIAENWEIPDWLEFYIDYEAIGHDHDAGVSGGFTSNGGFIEIY